MEIALNSDTYFANIETKSMAGSTALLSLCSAGWWSAETLAFLLRRKADVHARDNYGRTCLHNCLESRFWLNGQTTADDLPRLQDYRAGLNLLVQYGASTVATDSSGESVSDYAYRELEYREVSTGSSKGDTWDLVLVDCGYGISDFRRGFPRVGKYTAGYSRESFEKLWKGKAHICPYYYDEPVANVDFQGCNCEWRRVFRVVVGWRKACRIQRKQRLVMNLRIRRILALRRVRQSLGGV